MSLPLNEMISTRSPGRHLPPDGVIRANVFQLLEDFERGGVALNDGSRGLDVQEWKAWYSGTTIWIAPFPYTSPTALLTGLVDVTEISLSFDRNMNPAVVYIIAEVAYLYWYDAQLAAMTTTSFDAETPLLTHDDKRDINSSNSDVLFFYVRQGYLRYRQQRDRYLTERTISVVPSGRIIRAGMASDFRVLLVYRPGMR